jgi:hypothetical protein
MKANIHSENAVISWKRISIILKTFLVLGMLALLYFQVFSEDNLSDLGLAFNTSFSWANVWLLILTVALVLEDGDCCFFLEKRPLISITKKENVVDRTIQL